MGLSSTQVATTNSCSDWTQISPRDQSLEIPKPNTFSRKSSNQEALKCPRCDSSNTKFCYFNNYSKSQPRYYCKACKRHWTRGGTLRSVPVGGGRKNKRPKRSTKSAAAPSKSRRASPRNEQRLGDRCDKTAETGANADVMKPPSLDLSFHDDTDEKNDASFWGFNLDSGITNCTATHPWLREGSNGSEYWNLDDIENFVSADLNTSWFDCGEIKP